MNKEKQKRPVSKNRERYHQIMDGMGRYNMAMQSGFYIEAIALMESAISDRMESTLNYLFPFMDYSYGTIGYLADALSKTNCYSSELLSEIKGWAKKRNNAIHQMMKLLSDQDKSFQERYDELEQCAKEGKVLFGKFENEHRKLKRYQEKHPLVFKLKDPSKNPNNYPEILKIKCKVSDVKTMVDGFLTSQNSYYESEDGVMWSKNLLDLYYDLEII